MTCEAVRNIEDLFSEGRLTPARQARVQTHLKDCRACADRLEAGALARVKGAPAPKDLKDRMKKLLSRLETEEAEPAPEVFSVDGELWPVAATAAIYVGLALLLAWAGPGVPSERYAKAAPAEAVR